MILCHFVVKILPEFLKKHFRKYLEKIERDGHEVAEVLLVLI